MTALRASVVEAVGRVAHVVYVGKETAKWWNARRQADDTVQFCGWYWVRGREEMGPFRSRSACIRDIYYRFVLKREMPAVGHGLAFPERAKVTHFPARARRKA